MPNTKHSSQKSLQEKSSGQHTGSSQDQVFDEDATVADHKMGDNQAKAVPTSGAQQHKPEEKNRSR